jgi:hypothetical protein
MKVSDHTSPASSTPILDAPGNVIVQRPIHRYHLLHEEEADNLVLAVIALCCAGYEYETAFGLHFEPAVREA